ncbi:hypothetical protein CC85DRAFT_260108 [Cutaneotrichosporon oleaginosum]|uniref:PQ-loop-domain-containing protein n=1 Tax=Cutaneotrichosporon oleaginosum TaxID=879819 RepID=A0A0J0XN06_9TREE|nr:uncharacterized protein CC85DRAFT_260108 [Cutaneotrichosporon oleaginosum]KLT42491.1 hypothetical protein CC85DRAFT_260108 [Cutaneotrichosporon oleaginosum]TXT07764.1 hypothetical protein COLE_04688 [Cutaneotrichosporon oleaginosum]
MKEIPAADKTLATIGAVLWSIQVIPQIVKSYRTKSTEGLSPALMFIWACATIFQGSYLVSMRSSIPLQIQPQAFGGLGVVSWGQCLYYGKKYTLRRTLACVGTFYAVFVGFEVGSVYALWAGERRGITWPMQMYGWITSALLVLGLLPQYWEIWRHREVLGISIAFMLVDIGGGVFSGVSLFFRAHFDSTAFVQYFLVVVLDGVVVLLACVLNPLAKRRRAREAALADAENSAGVEDSGSPEVESMARALDRSDSYPRTVTLTAQPHDGKSDDESLLEREERVEYGGNGGRGDRAVSATDT